MDIEIKFNDAVANFFRAQDAAEILVVVAALAEVRLPEPNLIDLWRCMWLDCFCFSVCFKDVDVAVCVELPYLASKSACMPLTSWCPNNLQSTIW